MRGAPGPEWNPPELVIDPSLGIFTIEKYYNRKTVYEIEIVVETMDEVFPDVFTTVIEGITLTTQCGP